MAGYKVKWSTEAKLDLQNALNFYTLRNKSNTYSKKLAGKVRKVIEIISKNPFIGKNADVENVRMFILGPYQIIYEIKSPLQVLIIMFWDCRRNPEDKKIEDRISSK